MKKLVCHCGAVEAEINLDGDLAKVIKCNCSICKRKGAIMSMVKNEDFKIVKGEDKLKLYQFHSYGQYKGKSVSSYLGSWTIVIN